MQSLIERVALRILAMVQAHPAPDEPFAEIPEPIPPDLSRFARELTPRPADCKQGLATSTLHARLDDADIATVEQMIRDTPGAWEHYYADVSDEMTKKHVILALGIWLEAPSLVEKTGLTGIQPPNEVHAMARGPLAAAGGLYEADVVVDTLVSAGVSMENIGSGFDFGCSSGRVVRVLQAAYPDVKWCGADPNKPAIAWADEHLPGIEFFANNDAPPLPLADASLDMAYAISIWSHFAPDLGLRWFEEMRRVIRPGGHLVCTTHGPASIEYYATRELRQPEQTEEILEALYRHGWWYAPEFGEEGDWGVVNPDWGTAFVSPEWMITQLCPRWRVLEFVPGRNQENQDVYVLQRV